jgi:hypothetical protein
MKYFILLFLLLPITVKSQRTFTYKFVTDTVIKRFIAVDNFYFKFQHTNAMVLLTMFDKNKYKMATTSIGHDALRTGYRMKLKYIIRHGNLKIVSLNIELKTPAFAGVTLFPTRGFKKEFKEYFMEEVTIVDYTFALAQFIKAHPQEAVHKNSLVYIFVVDGQMVETIFRSLN